MDRSFSCDCSGTIYSGLNCDTTSLAVGGGRDSSGTDVSYAVTGVAITLVLLAILVLVVARRRVLAAKRRPEDFEAIQTQILADLGLMAPYDIGLTDVGITLTFNTRPPLDAIKAPLVTHILNALRIDLTYGGHAQDIRVREGDRANDVLVVLPQRAQEGKGDFATHVVSVIAHRAASGGLSVVDRTTGIQYNVVKAGVRLPKKVQTFFPTLFPAGVPIAWCWAA